MNRKLRATLISVAEQNISTGDPAHDFQHALRVLALTDRIAKAENADVDILVPASLFHDIINYPKNDIRSKNAADESAEVAGKILNKVTEYPNNKIGHVQEAICHCSYTKGIIPNFLEARILQDADGLEATGAISIMRTFSSTGSMKRAFYHTTDPFCKNREPDDLKFALDLFFTRLLRVGERMHTETARQIAERRTLFLQQFLKEVRLELEGH
jgi:uncharacterized protein